MKKTNFKVISAFIILLPVKILVVCVVGCTINKIDLEVIDDLDSNQELLEVINTKKYEQKIFFTDTVKDLQDSVPIWIKANLNESNQKKFRHELFFINKIIIKESQQELTSQNFKQFETLNLIINYDYDKFKNQTLELRIVVENTPNIASSLNNIFNDKIATLQTRIKDLEKIKENLEIKLAFYEELEKQIELEIIEEKFYWDERITEVMTDLSFNQAKMQDLKDFKDFAWDFDYLPGFNNEAVIEELVEDFSQDSPELKNIWEQVLASKKNNNQKKFDKNVEILYDKLNDYLILLRELFLKQLKQTISDSNNQITELEMQLIKIFNKKELVLKEWEKLRFLDIDEINRETNEILLQKECLNDELIVNLKKLQNSISDFRNSFFKL